MRLTMRGWIVAGVATFATASVALPIIAPLPNDRVGDGITETVMVCGEGLDGMPGVACFHPDDVPTND